MKSQFKRCYLAGSSCSECDLFLKDTCVFSNNFVGKALVTFAVQCSLASCCSRACRQAALSFGCSLASCCSRACRQH